MQQSWAMVRPSSHPRRPSKDAFFVLVSGSLELFWGHLQHAGAIHQLKSVLAPRPFARSTFLGLWVARGALVGKLGGSRRRTWFRRKQCLWRSLVRL
ncbi:hypothetical protein EDB81DRAFT_831486 [Dactylonectria macrodidyma]|uniref:Uncharacterized protein n=1 Tax=Dactylonectria macrodidyma TaxID=307937 RepID=A0A9P9D1E4_9HYPO|nr:hypothetical protein EDB81DRAFT_831486 [Dactylonectria macrodidyma]